MSVAARLRFLRCPLEFSGEEKGTTYVTTRRALDRVRNSDRNSEWQDAVEVIRAAARRLFFAYKSKKGEESGAGSPQSERTERRYLKHMQRVQLCNFAQERPEFYATFFLTIVQAAKGERENARCDAMPGSEERQDTVEGIVANRQMSATKWGNPETDINANVIIASHEGEKKAKKISRRNREDECNEKGSFYSFLEVRWIRLRTRVLVYQFMRFEFNQRTRLTGGTRKFWDIRCKNFSEASRLYRRNVPYVRVMCPEKGTICEVEAFNATLSSGFLLPEENPRISLSIVCCYVVKEASASTAAANNNNKAH
ncbi:hypothetical protein ALC57_12236 [Trachymyrmex cornetzi]|uniref:Uncharacterized protein n=1 Tax=Trachymyrmex cornetzi TaxID=471704 RepID=A0A151J195_9HYME|nr:hypothetical protein ALC57_12236 [Trachymyrmex cornetzi]